MVHFTVYKDSISLAINGKFLSVSGDDPMFETIMTMVSDIDNYTDDDFLDILDISKPVASYISESGDTEIKDGVIYYKGEPIESSMTDLILENMELNLPFQNLVNFYEKLQDNPSYRSRNQLWNFISKFEFPISHDGDFIAWKGVDSDYYDIKTRTIKYESGKIVEMPRSQVSDDPAEACAPGLHVGTQDYASSWAGYSGRVIACKVNPRDVVRVPYDHNYSKCATCRLEVLGEVNFINRKEK